jgi:Flp pilus assembly pilin Flp
MIRDVLATLNDDDGASLVEYALVVALVAVIAFVAVRLLGSNTSASLTNSANSIAS